MRLRRVIVAAASGSPKEAEQDARLRRRRVAVILAAAVIAVVGAAAAIGSGGVGSPDEPTAGDGEQGSVMFSTAEEPVALVASWGEVHVGWIRIYANGRVVRVSGMPIDERRLTPDGLDLVRSGVLTAHDVFALREREFDWIWADERLRPYAPAAYALCFWMQLESTGYAVPASVAFDRLTPPAQALVRGTERDFDIVEAFGMWEWPRQECFSVSPDVADAMLRLDETSAWNRAGDPDSLDLWVEPVLPEGRLIRWGG